MRINLKLAALALAMGAVLFSTTGCKAQADHPNQINTFDGASYDSLTVAHVALGSLRGQIAGTYPQYATQFNQAAVTYSTAFNAYSLYRSAATASNQAEVTVAIRNLTLSIVVLENAFENDMHVSGKSEMAIRGKAARIRAAASSNVSVVDILTELEIAASIAETVPQTQPYAQLAAMVIAVTDEAVDALDAAAGQPIDLSTIQPIPTIQ